MRITSKGQVTIPVEIREQLGLLPHAEVRFDVDGNSVRISRVADGVNGRGHTLIQHLHGRRKGGLTTDEIMALTRSET